MIMKNYHTEFKFNLFVLGLVHIGSGKKYTKKEYIYMKTKNIISLIWGNFT